MKSNPDFTDSQTRIIEHNKGNAAVLAVAGAGKTTVMTYRAERLIKEGLVELNDDDQHRLLMVTFTKKAAESMKNKLRSLAPEANATLRTFHSFCYLVLREFDPRFKVKDCLLSEREEWMPTQWAEMVIKTLRLSRDTKPADIIKIVDSCKVRGIHPDHIYDADCPLAKKISEHDKQVYSCYAGLQAKKKKFDFSDLIVYCFDLLRRDSDIRDAVRGWYDHIMVDEYQDTDPCQEMILEMIGGCPHPTLKDEIEVIPEAYRPTVMVVGDDDQSIYGFRHAEPEFIINFREKWDATAYFMEENFRSYSPILMTANQLIANNTVRIQKRLKPVTGDAGDVVVLAHLDEARGVLEEVRRLREEENLDWGRIAILYRTNAQSCLYESYFTEESIPYVCIGQKEGFYGMTPVKTMLSYLRLIVDPENISALEYIWNRPTRYLKKEILMQAKEMASGEGVLSIIEEAIDQAGHNSWRLTRLRDVMKTLFTMKDQTPLSIIQWLRSELDFDDWLRELSQRTNTTADDILQVVDRMLDDARRHDTISEFLEHVNRVIANTKKQEAGNAIQLMTLHRSKGLEFDVVFFSGVVRDLVPHPHGDLEEERRLAYVGVTRAIRRLYICTNEHNVSPFVQEMGLQLPNRAISVPELRPLTDEDVIRLELSEDLERDQ